MTLFRMTLCFVADVELVDVFGHVGIRYDFRTAVAVTNESQNMEPELENVFALLFGAVNV